MTLPNEGGEHSVEASGGLLTTGLARGARGTWALLACFWWCAVGHKEVSGRPAAANILHSPPPPAAARSPQARSAANLAATSS